MLQARKHVSSPIIWQREQWVSTQASKNAKHLANSNTDKAGRKNRDGHREATKPVTLFAKERHQRYQHSVQKLLLFTSWKVPKYGAISGPHLPAFGPNTAVFSTNAGKYGPEITPRPDTFHAVVVIDYIKQGLQFLLYWI